MKGLNDAVYILAAIYVSSIVLAVIIVGTYSLKDKINVYAAVFCTGFIVGTTVILGLVFGPKVRRVLVLTEVLVSNVLQKKERLSEYQL